MQETVYWSAEGEFLGVDRPSDEDMTGGAAELWQARARLRRRLSIRPVIYCAVAHLTPRPRAARARRSSASSSPAPADDGEPAAAAFALAAAVSL